LTTELNFFFLKLAKNEIVFQHGAFFEFLTNRLSYPCIVGSTNLLAFHDTLLLLCLWEKTKKNNKTKKQKEREKERKKREKKKKNKENILFFFCFFLVLSLF
jgi:uncharacterized membrane protein